MTSVRLINVGWVEAINAADLKPGMKIMWNYGSTSDVLSVTDVSPKYVSVRTRSNGTSDNGTEYEFRRKKDAPIVAYWPKEKGTIYIPA